MKIVKSISSIINSYEKRRSIFYALILLVVTFSAAYVFMINQTVVKVAERDALSTEISELKSEITTLEFEYISRKNSVDLKTALAMGFIETDSVGYVSRRSLSPTLSQNFTQ